MLAVRLGYRGASAAPSHSCQTWTEAGHIALGSFKIEILLVHSPVSTCFAITQGQLKPVD